MKRILTILLCCISLLAVSQSPTVKDIKVINSVKFIDTTGGVNTITDSVYHLNVNNDTLFFNSDTLFFNNNSVTSVDSLAHQHANVYKDSIYYNGNWIGQGETLNVVTSGSDSLYYNKIFVGSSSNIATPYFYKDFNNYDSIGPVDVIDSTDYNVKILVEKADGTRTKEWMSFKQHTTKLTRTFHVSDSTEFNEAIHYLQTGTSYTSGLIGGNDLTGSRGGTIVLTGRIAIVGAKQINANGITFKCIDNGTGYRAYFALANPSSYLYLLGRSILFDKVDFLCREDIPYATEGASTIVKTWLENGGTVTFNQCRFDRIGIYNGDGQVHFRMMQGVANHHFMTFDKCSFVSHSTASGYNNFKGIAFSDTCSGTGGLHFGSTIINVFNMVQNPEAGYNQYMSNLFNPLLANRVHIIGSSPDKDLRAFNSDGTCILATNTNNFRWTNIGTFSKQGVGFNTVPYYPNSFNLGTNKFSIEGDCQTSNFILRDTTLNSTEDTLKMFYDTSQVVCPGIKIPLDATIKIEIDIMGVGNNSDSIFICTWKGWISNLGGVCTGALVEQNDSINSKNAVVSTNYIIDDTNDNLLIIVKGSTANKWYWNANVKMQIIGFRNYNIQTNY